MTRHLPFVLLSVLVACHRSPYIYVFAPADGSACPVAVTPRLDAIAYVDGPGEPHLYVEGEILDVKMTINAANAVRLYPDPFGYIHADLPADLGEYQVRLYVYSPDDAFTTTFRYSVSEDQPGPSCGEPVEPPVEEESGPEETGDTGHK